MKRFILTGLALLALAAAAAVIVFFVVRSYSLPTNIEQLKEDVGTKVQESFLDNKDSSAIASSTLEALGESGIPLKDLSLEGAQKKALEVAGIDTETFVISKDMLICAEEKLGAQRVAEFIAGEAPGVIEIGKLLPCLNTN